MCNLRRGVFCGILFQLFGHFSACRLRVLKDEMFGRCVLFVEFTVLRPAPQSAVSKYRIVANGRVASVLVPMFILGICRRNIHPRKSYIPRKTYQAKVSYLCSEKLSASQTPKQGSAP